jgi:hypothetical protein
MGIPNQKPQPAQLASHHDINMPNSVTVATIARPERYSHRTKATFEPYVKQGKGRTAFTDLHRRRAVRRGSTGGHAIHDHKAVKRAYRPGFPTTVLRHVFGTATRREPTPTGHSRTRTSDRKRKKPRSS